MPGPNNYVNLIKAVRQSKLSPLHIQLAQLESDNPVLADELLNGIIN